MVMAHTSGNMSWSVLSYASHLRFHFSIFQLSKFLGLKYSESMPLQPSNDGHPKSGDCNFTCVGCSVFIPKHLSIHVQLGLDMARQGQSGPLGEKRTQHIAVRNLYSLVSIQQTMDNHNALMGKLHISTGPCSS